MNGHVNGQDQKPFSFVIVQHMNQFYVHVQCVSLQSVESIWWENQALENQAAGCIYAN